MLTSYCTRNDGIPLCYAVYTWVKSMRPVKKVSQAANRPFFWSIHRRTGYDVASSMDEQ